MPTLRSEYEAYRRRYGMLAAHLPEFVAVRAGLKKALQITLGPPLVRERERPLLERLSAGAGLQCTFYVRRGLAKVLISRGGIEPPELGEDENVDNRFSYPECCVEAFIATGEEYYLKNGLRGLLAPPEGLSFRLNPFTVATPFHLLTHLPCSPRCPRTLADTERLLVLLRQRTPALAAGIERWCRRPVLYTDICGIGILLDGEWGGTRIGYRALDYVGEPDELLDQSPHNEPDDVDLFSDLVAALADGDEVELRGTTLVVRGGGRELRRYLRPAHLDWRLVRFT